MNKLELFVNDENLETVLMILDNLKVGLISEISHTSKVPIKRDIRYKPKTNRVIYEEESGTHDSSGKYMPAKIYKQRFKK